MPLTIEEIKKQLREMNVLDDVYDIYDEKVTKGWGLSVNDLIVQVWIDLMLKKHKPSFILPLIPHEQVWFKRILIKMMIGHKVFNFEKVINALEQCDKISEDELHHIHLYHPQKMSV